jgi:hypothetical protein
MTWAVPTHNLYIDMPVHQRPKRNFGPSISVLLKYVLDSRKDHLIA